MRVRARVGSLTAGNCTKDNFPLVFSEVELVVREAELNTDFLRRFLPKLDWVALVDTARSLGDTSLPDEMPAEWSDEQLQALHHVLLEVGVDGGWMRAARRLWGSWEREASCLSFRASCGRTEGGEEGGGTARWRAGMGDGQLSLSQSSWRHIRTR
jgi:hypothetical protein